MEGTFSTVNYHGSGVRFHRSGTSLSFHAGRSKGEMEVSMEAPMRALKASKKVLGASTEVLKVFMKALKVSMGITDIYGAGLKLPWK